MDVLASLLAGLLNALRAQVGSDICPGGWAWATSALGVAIGLLPTVGTIGVAVWRRRIGSRYGVAEATVLAATGVLTAGVLPLLAFTAVGQVFSAAAAGGSVPGLTSGAVRNLNTEVCFVGPQSTYLGSGSVGAAFDPADPVRFGTAVLLLGLVPVFAALFVAAQARLALRRGPRWPAKFFWLPTLALTVFTARTPAGATEHLWVGFTAGAFLGIVLTAMAGAPSREVVRRSLTPPEPPRRPRPAGPRADAPQRAGAAAVPNLADRLAERFAARDPEPPVEVPRQRTDAASTPAPGSTAVSAPGSSSAPGSTSGPGLAATPGPVPLGARAPSANAPSAPPPSTQSAVVPPSARPPVYPPTLVAGAMPTRGPGRGARFHLIRRLGSGGFGRVWLAHDHRLGQTVALKSAHAPDAETEQRIQREAAALSAVRHPNCVRIHDLVHAGSDPGLVGLEGLVIVMEHVEGMSLGQLVHERGPLDDVSAARVWAGIAGALDAAHQRGVLHRDVKPGNVIVDPGGLAHLIDFGIARRTGDVTLTMAGFVLGTPDYLAPEVAAGSAASPASDAWQLAATISYALTGFPPRGGHADALSGLRAAAVGAKLTHLPRRTAHLPLLKAALKTDPARRPDLLTAHRALEEWLRRNGTPFDGPVAAGLSRR
ncbi:serine/threonine-protein kinase [Pseudonocardia sp. H11422]|uniref:serine/threonine-protein kinase n=1 Tax=Pseudonocardia sp. H11422 TaxID=2835866 RepID=UPI0027E22EDF|nr:protein kinase [Pseudonocardia sp. H11422]